ncbi:structural maintenance-chromosome 4 [Apiospora aurea]|uniref:Structural maintenance-chromosome 4 n=1 Tax=Apiospora aurea TaxID=335848 RepID=A0ABR1PWV3_9PEZI
MSGRPSRRAAAARRAVIEESSEDDGVGDTTGIKKQEDDSEDEFSIAPPPPPPTRAPRKSTAAKRKTAASAGASTTTRARRTRRSAAPSSAEPSEILDADTTSTTVRSAQTDEIAEEPEVEEPVKKLPVPRKRKTAAKTAVPRKASRKSETPEVQQPPPDVEQTPARSTSEAPQETPAPPTSEPPQETPSAAQIPDPQSPQPTPQSTMPPTSAQPPATPLPDNKQLKNETPATVKHIKTGDETPATVKPIKALDTILERPMDIVLKSRSQMTVPIPEETGPKSRTVISYLILNNFKSYAGRQEVGPFHASFSSVVGPNGSGKSNVIDSLLFVFGFRASKMRQGKVSALIHNSAQYPNLDHCEVAVYFQEVMDLPGGGSEVVPNSQLVISRKAFKNNSSKYYIDGKESTFTIVTTLLRDRGVDLDHKRFLILQGEVESIAQMKPKAGNEHEDGLLEYLEDIIGTSKYKTPIEESATEVETLNEICMEKSGRVQHVEKEKNSLEDKKDKALAFIRDENELTLKQSALYQLYISECNDNVNVTEEAINQMQAQLDDELEKHQGSEQHIKQLQKTYSKGSKEYEAMEKEHQALAKEVAKFEQERVKFDEKRKFLTDKRKKLEKTIANAEKSSTEADETIEQCTEEITTSTEQIGALEETIQEEEAELATIRDSLKGKTQVFSDQIATKQKSLEPWKDKINQKQSAIAVAQSELTILEEKANAGAVALEEMNAKITSIAEGREAKIAQLEECENEKAQLEKEAKKVESDLAQFASKEHIIRNKVSNARQKADEARSSLASNQNRGNVLTALMRMKESGRIDGFHGRLGNLGAIDPKYDVAISTACGALDNFVTDTVEAGQQCIEYLRKTNLGRGNFMCLDKLRARGMDAIQTPENAPRLFDLVSAKDDRFRPAFYHALQDTLVANDLAQANRIAYGAKRWRVVTLAGELIDKSGTMSGGGNTVKKGLMSSKLVADTSKEQVTQLEEDRDVLEQKFQKFQDQQRELESRLRFINNQIPQLETKMQKLNLEIQSAEKNIVDAKRRIKELGKEHQPSQTDDNRAAALQKEIAKLEKEVTKLHSETEDVEAEIKELQDKIMEVGGEKLRAQRAKVDSMKEEMASHNEAISAAEVKRAKAEKSKTKLERDHAKATKEVDAAIRDLEKLEAEVENQGEKSELLQGRVDEAEAALTEKKEELATIKAELDEKTTELNETRAVEIEMRNKLEENHKALGENQKRLRYWNEKLSKLHIQNISDLEGAPAPKKADGADASQIAEGAEAAEAAEGEPTEPMEGEEPTKKGDNGDEAEDDEDAEGEDEDDSDEDEAETSKVNAGDKTRGPDELPRFTDDELKDMSKERLKAEIAALEEKVQNVNVDLAVLAEYRRRVEEHASRSSDLATAVAQRDAAKKRCDDLRRLRLEGFMEGFSTISLRLKEMYQMITMGGNAELELVDSLDPFSEGILFSVMPPKKSWKNISNLSGGEKTLSSLALVFALHHYKPTPLYVMDEIDAALDFRNVSNEPPQLTLPMLTYLLNQVSIVANYIKERTKNAQFIVISLRNNMFELAARLVGVYKVNHMTKSVTIENKDYINRPVPASQRPAGGGMTMTAA